MALLGLANMAHASCSGALTFGVKLFFTFSSTDAIRLSNGVAGICWLELQSGEAIDAEGHQSGKIIFCGIYLERNA